MNGSRTQTVPTTIGEGSCHMNQYVRNHDLLSKNAASLSIVQDNARSYSTPPLRRMLNSNKTINNGISPKTKVSQRWESSPLPSSSTRSVTNKCFPERWLSGEKILPRDIKRMDRFNSGSSRSPIDNLLMSSPAYMEGKTVTSVLDNVKAALANDLSLLPSPQSDHQSEHRDSTALLRGIPLSAQSSPSVKGDSRHALVRPNRVPSKDSLPVSNRDSNKLLQHDSHKQNMSWGSNSKVASTSLLPRSAFRKRQEGISLSHLKPNRRSGLVGRNTTV